MFSNCESQFLRNKIVIIGYYQNEKTEEPNRQARRVAEKTVSSNKNRTLVTISRLST